MDTRNYFVVYIMGMVICPFLSILMNLPQRTYFTEVAILTLSIFLPLTVKYAIIVESEKLSALLFGQFIALALVSIGILFSHYNYELLNIVYGLLAAIILAWILTALLYYDGKDKGGVKNTNKCQNTTDQTRNSEDLSVVFANIPVTRRSSYQSEDIITSVNKEFGTHI